MTKKKGQKEIQERAMSNNLKDQSGFTAFMAKSSVTANLIMAGVFVAAFIFMSNIKQEIIPKISFDMISVNVLYYGADPKEIEEDIIAPIEEKVRDVEGVKKIVSIARENFGEVYITLFDGHDKYKILDDVKNKVDRVRMPENATDPQIFAPALNLNVLTLFVHGPQELMDLHNIAERIRQDLVSIDGVTQVRVRTHGKFQVSIEISRETLEKYGLTMHEISQQVQSYKREIAGGTMRSDRGDILIYSGQKVQSCRDYLDIPILVAQDGTSVKLGSIAKVREILHDPSHMEDHFNGENTVQINIFAAESERPVDVANLVKGYIADINNKVPLPPNVKVSCANDFSEMFNGRMELLIKNAIQGLILVFVVLSLFLEIRLAFWVIAGISFAITGAFISFAMFGTSINMVTMFGFIMTLGIVVDDAVVAGENIYEMRTKKMSNLRAAIVGIKEVQTPIIFAVLTNVVAFLPMFFVPGFMGKMFFQIPSVVVPVLLLSLFESLYILPAHLAHESSKAKIWDYLNYPQRYFSQGLQFVSHQYFTPMLHLAIKFRYITLCSSIAITMILGAMMQNGTIPTISGSGVEGNKAAAKIELSPSASLEKARSVEKKLTDSAFSAMDSYGDKNVVQGLLTTIGYDPNPIIKNDGSHIITGTAWMKEDKEKGLESSSEFSKRWIRKLGMIPDARSLTITGIESWGNEKVSIEVSHPNDEISSNALTALKNDLSEYAGINEISDRSGDGKKKYSFSLNEAAIANHFVPGLLSSQLLHAFSGAEAMKSQRSGREWEVVVRLPEEERDEIYTLDRMHLQIPGAYASPLAQNTNVKRSYSDTFIERIDGRKIKNLTIDFRDGVSDTKIMDDIKDNVFPKLRDNHPGLKVEFGGRAQDDMQSRAGLITGFLMAMIFIYVLLAMNFQSYLQPIIIMVAIPFGVIGAVIGHVIFGEAISMLSICGLVALTGIVVNDSLLLISTANRYLREDGMDHKNAIEKASIRRLRPILLTSLTTFFGLVPITLETSLHAKFLVPMAISISFGVLFASLVILFLVPALYVILEDAKSLFGKPLKAQVL